MDRNNLSPLQFGFHLVSRDEWGDAAMNAPTRGQVKHIPIDTVLHTGQRSIYNDRVQEYVHNPHHEPDNAFEGVDIPEVYHWNGKNYMGDGHHRVSAARARGDKTVEVNWFGP